MRISFVVSFRTLDEAPPVQVGAACHRSPPPAGTQGHWDLYIGRYPPSEQASTLWAGLPWDQALSWGPEGLKPSQGLIPHPCPPRGEAASTPGAGRPGSLENTDLPPKGDIPLKPLPCSSQGVQGAARWSPLRASCKGKAELPGARRPWGEAASRQSARHLIIIMLLINSQLIAFPVANLHSG